MGDRIAELHVPPGFIATVNNGAETRTSASLAHVSHLLKPETQSTTIRNCTKLSRDNFSLSLYLSPERKTTERMERSDSNGVNSTRPILRSTFVDTRWKMVRIELCLNARNIEIALLFTFVNRRRIISSKFQSYVRGGETCARERVKPFRWPMQYNCELSWTRVNANSFGR